MKIFMNVQAKHVGSLKRSMKAERQSMESNMSPEAVRAERAALGVRSSGSNVGRPSKAERAFRDSVRTQQANAAKPTGFRRAQTGNRTSGR